MNFYLKCGFNVKIGDVIYMLIKCEKVCGFLGRVGWFWERGCYGVFIKEWVCFVWMGSYEV